MWGFFGMFSASTAVRLSHVDLGHPVLLWWDNTNLITLEFCVRIDSDTL